MGKRGRKKGQDNDSILDARYAQWAKKVNEADSLSNDKLFALNAAVDLRYSDEILERIVKATSSIQIDNIMATQRLAC